MERLTQSMGLALLLLLAGVSASVWLVPQSLAQSGSRGSGMAPQQRSAPAVVAPRQQQQPFEEKLWNWIQSAQYKNWAPMPGQSDDAYPGESPHGEKLKLYVNRIAAGNPKQLPLGSLLIKENYGADGQTLMAVTVMYRSRGFDPEHGDWYWAKYEADGRVATMKGMPVAGRVGMCIECHTAAGGGDYSFANDR